jgi:hypothetical protein
MLQWRDYLLDDCVRANLRAEGCAVNSITLVQSKKSRHGSATIRTDKKNSCAQPAEPPCTGVSEDTTGHARNRRGSRRGFSTSGAQEMQKAVVGLRSSVVGCDRRLACSGDGFAGTFLARVRCFLVCGGNRKKAATDPQPFARIRGMSPGATRPKTGRQAVAVVQAPRSRKGGETLRLRSGQALGHPPSSSPDLLDAKFAIVLLDNPVALTGGVFKFLAVQDLHGTAGVLDELLPLQNASCQAHGGSVGP